MLRLFYTDSYVLPLPAGHRFPIAKYELLRKALAATGLFRFEPAPLAPPEIIELAHDRAYVSAFLGGTLGDQAMRRIGFPWSEGLVERTLASAGGTLAAVRDALSAGFGGTLAGGTHHAFRDAGSGFCVFNDLAIAVLAMRSEGRIRRAAILDLDVHQGDGTAAIFEDDPETLTISLHGGNNFPFRKQRSTIDVALPDGTRDHEYLVALENVLPPVREFQPDLLLYQSGVDALAGDRLGRLSLTHGGLLERDRKVVGFAHKLGVPLAITLGGGYAQPIEDTVCAHATTFRVAACTFTSLNETSRQSGASY
jgi:acetoin utilization deacetylase AcuC-like enzyme